MKYNWIITTLECKVSENGLNNVISTIHWRYSATNENGITADTYGSQNVPSPIQTEGEYFIPYENITKEIIIEWLESALEVELIQNRLNAQINLIENPTIVSLPLPFTQIDNQL